MKLRILILPFVVLCLYMGGACRFITDSISISETEAEALLRSEEERYFNEVNNSESVFSPSEGFGDFETADHFLRRAERKIVFIETFGKKAICLNHRQACAVESTARQNPNVSVVLFSRAYSISENCSSFHELLKVPNVKMFHLDVAKVAKGTALEEWTDLFINNKIRSRYKSAHLSDALRLIIIQKYSALYMDLDFITLRPLDSLLEMDGVIVKEDADHLANGLMGLRKPSKLIEESMTEMANTYDGSQWRFNGPSLIERITSRLGCDWAKGCFGVRFLDPDTIYPNHWSEAVQLFHPKFSKLGEEYLNDTKLLTVHFWNGLTHHLPSPVGMRNAINECARSRCPSSFRVAVESETRNF